MHSVTFCNFSRRAAAKWQVQGNGKRSVAIAQVEQSDQIQKHELDSNAEIARLLILRIII